MATVLEYLSSKLDARMEDMEGRSHRCNLRFVGFLESIEKGRLEAFMEDWIK